MPDSALMVIRSIPEASLKSKRDKALLSLLHSQALDKCYIDLQTDSIIAPAVKYYSRHGSYDNRLKTCYYRARIYQNAGDNDSAMEWLVKGERFISRCNDATSAGRLYSVKSELFYYAYDFARALENAAKASDFFLTTNDIRRYISSQLDIASYYIGLREYDKASAVLNNIHSLWDSLSEKAKSIYYSRRMVTSAYVSDLKEAGQVRDSCIAEISKASLVPWLDVANVYLKENDPDTALTCLDKYSKYHPDYVSDKKYYSILSGVYAAMRDYEASLSSYKKFVNTSGLYDLDVLKSSMYSKERQYRSEIDSLQKDRKDLFIFLLFTIILCLTLILLMISRLALYRKQTYIAELEEKCEQLYHEQLVLSELKESQISDGFSSLIDSRLALLDCILVGQISSSPAAAKEAEKQIDLLIQDRDKFILSASSLLAVRNSKLHSHLKESGLTDWEIGYCSILMMGVQAKDMDIFFSQRTSYSLNGIIRKKLQLPANGQKLKAYLNSFGS